MSEMIERVARAIASAKGVPPAHTWRWYEPAARAAIEAMREPTAELFDAGGRAMCVFPNAKWDDAHVQADKHGLRTATVEVIDRTWRAMIDEALK